MKIQDGAEHNVIFLYFLDFSFKYYIVCAVKPSYVTAHFSYAKRRFDILRPVSMSDGRIAWTNGSNERTRAWWGNFVSKTVNEAEWWRVKFSHEPKIALQIL